MEASDRRLRLNQLTILDNVFCGDSIFHVDIGTARCDFPGGSADHLWESGQKLLSLGDHVRIWTGHDYPPNVRGVSISKLSVRDHKAENKHLKEGMAKEEFVDLRHERDAQLTEPKLIHPSLQINILAGRLPKLTESGHRMLHIPVKTQGLEW